MKDELESLVPSDDELINIKDAWQVLWWCRVLNVTKTQLESAVAAVGTQPDEVRRFINQNKHA